MNYDKGRVRVTGEGFLREDDPLRGLCHRGEGWDSRQGSSAGTPSPPHPGART